MQELAPKERRQGLAGGLPQLEGWFGTWRVEAACTGDELEQRVAFDLTVAVSLDAVELFPKTEDCLELGVVPMRLSTSRFEIGGHGLQLDSAGTARFGDGSLVAQLSAAQEAVLFTDLAAREGAIRSAEAMSRLSFYAAPEPRLGLSWTEDFETAGGTVQHAVRCKSESFARR